jgi:hypothetical protein
MGHSERRAAAQERASPGQVQAPHASKVLRRAGLLGLDDCSMDGSNVRALRRGITSALTHRPCPLRLEAPPDRRPPRNPARRHPHRRQPARHHPAPAAAGRRPTDPGTSGTPPPLVRRPGLRLRQVPPPAVEARIKPVIARRGVSPTAPEWARCAGWSSAPSSGCTSSNGSAPATNDAQVSTRASSNWPAASYAFAFYEPHTEAISWLR